MYSSNTYFVVLTPSELAHLCVLVFAINIFLFDGSIQLDDSGESPSPQCQMSRLVRGACSTRRRFDNSIALCRRVELHRRVELSRMASLNIHIYIYIYIISNISYTKV